ncbi:MAG: LysE family transporter [Austwickia sp.]|nr:LysE family transporter [Austwickia sp.]MBK8437583.1 LysE family transporter [Austwickia sp.]MBK9102849.1 LysE family transporter [Austwickia sp.]
MSALLLGLGLGFASGLSPGPMLVLVIITALQWGARHAVAVACAPLLSDLPIVAVALLALGRLPGTALAGLGVIGGIVIMALGAQTMHGSRTATLTPRPGVTPPSAWSALRTGAVVNLMNPHPWLAWMTAFGPLTLTTWRESRPAAVLLLGGFYGALVGAKVVIALLVAGGRQRLSAGRYQAVVFGSGGALTVIGGMMVVQFASSLRAG